MNDSKVWLNMVFLSSMLACAPAFAEKGKDEDPKPTYKSSIQLPEGTEDNEKAELPKLRKLVKITEANATKTAQARVGAGKYVRTKLENEGGNLVYVVEFAVGKKEREVVVDAGTGKILADRFERSSEKDDDDK